MQNRKIKLFVFPLFVLLISIGYAVISSNLSINGTFNFTQNEWNIYFKNIQLDSGSISTVKPTISNNKLSLSFSVSFNKPGEYYLFYVDAVNDSTLDAMINEVKIEGLDEVTDYLECNVTYQEGKPIEKNDILYKSFSNTYRIELKYKDITVEQIPSNNLTPTVTISINYRQANKDGVLKEDTNYVYFAYKTSEYTYVVPMNATYKLEVWGAQGGEVLSGIGGYGGYSVGSVNLINNQTLFVAVGGRNYFNQDGTSYNGGGQHCVGGGATHIALGSENRGQLFNYEEHVDELLIVAGGGGGSERIRGGSGGGYIGATGSTSITGGTQTSGGTGQGNLEARNGRFGVGGSGIAGVSDGAGGGGGGYYGGGGITWAGGGGGGSGYIGNTNLTDKIMYCYNCQESTSEEDETHIKTRSTTNVSSRATSKYAKSGTGYARISLVNLN